MVVSTAVAVAVVPVTVAVAVAVGGGVVLVAVGSEGWRAVDVAAGGVVAVAGLVVGPGGD